MAKTDVGIPILAMHSISQTAGALDTDMMIRALAAALEAGE